MEIELWSALVVVAFLVGVSSGLILAVLAKHIINKMEVQHVGSKKPN